MKFSMLFMVATTASTQKWDKLSYCSSSDEFVASKIGKDIAKRADCKAWCLEQDKKHGSNDGDEMCCDHITFTYVG